MLVWRSIWRQHIVDLSICNADDVWNDRQIIHNHWSWFSLSTSCSRFYNQGNLSILNWNIKLNLKSETVGDEDGLDLDMLIDQETALRIFRVFSWSLDKKFI